MKLITLFVGNRLDHVVNFDREEQQVVETYIIKREEKTDLFALYHGIGSSSDSILFGSEKKKQDNGNEIIFQNDDGQKTVQIKTISAEKKENVINIDIELNKEQDGQKPEQKGLKEAGLEFYSQDSAQWVMKLETDPKNKDIVIVNISFKLKLGEYSYSQKLKLCVAEERDISDVVLDFGSEASQTGIFKRGVRQTESGIRELFTEMESMLSSSSTTSGESSGETSTSLSESYVQRDNNKHFFKSVFFARKQFNDEESGTPIPELEASTKHVKENNVMKMLTTQMDAQNLVKHQGFIQIPNVKITQFGGVKQPKVGPNKEPILDYQDGYFYRASVNCFILNALRNASTPCICLYVLMPNVYSQLSIIDHLRWIRKDVIDILRQNPVLADKIKAVELSAISESDASLLGAIRVIEDNPRSNEIVEPGKYIIIDAGKGTLDYSAIQYETEPEPKVYSIYRSGIIGAGNSLTYAYLFALLRDYMNQAVNGKTSEEELQSFIFENVLGHTDAGVSKGGGDIANLSKLMLAVERYKILSSSEGRKVDAAINPLSSTAKHINWKDVEMTTVTDFINKMIPQSTQTYKPLSDEAKQYVANTINQIVDEVYASLSILKDLKVKEMDFGKADGIIFAGRGFAHPEFKKAMKQKLEDNDIADEELTYMRNDVAINQKSVCLYIRTAIQEGHYNNHMTSVPIVLRSTSHPMEEKKDFITRIQEFFGFGRKKDKSQIAENVSKCFKVILDSREGLYHTPGSTEANGMVTGFTQTIVNSDSLMIGGTKYRIRITGEVTIFYSGEKIYYRYTDEHGKTRVRELTEDGVNLQNSPFLFGTLFPCVDVENVADVRLPFDPDSGRKRQEQEAEEQRKKDMKKRNAGEMEKENNAEEVDEQDDCDNNGGLAAAAKKALELVNKV